MATEWTTTRTIFHQVPRWTRPFHRAPPLGRMTISIAAMANSTILSHWTVDLPISQLRGSTTLLSMAAVSTAASAAPSHTMRVTTAHPRLLITSLITSISRLACITTGSLNLTPWCRTICRSRSLCRCGYGWDTALLHTADMIGQIDTLLSAESCLCAYRNHRLSLLLLRTYCIVLLFSYFCTSWHQCVLWFFTQLTLACAGHWTDVSLGR